MRKDIAESVKRRLYAESMGRCMNPACQKELFGYKGDLIEKAHIDPYCKTADNSFENLVVLCPNCHTDFDKNNAFSPEEILNWKKIRQSELAQFFAKQFNSFADLANIVVPILQENKTIYEKYYLGNNKTLWNKFEPVILANNNKLRSLLQANLNLFQSHKQKEYSNQELILCFLTHIAEFEMSRLDNEKNRQIFFPEAINSIFGISPLKKSLMTMTESIEDLITKLNNAKILHSISIGNDDPKIFIIDNSQIKPLYLDDEPRLRQLFFEYNCFKQNKIRFQSLNYALKFIASQNIRYDFLQYNNLHEIIIKGTKIIFVYEYCFSQMNLIQLCPEPKSIIVNLHNWNGDSCISSEAYSYSKQLDVHLLTMPQFYDFIRSI